MIEVKGVWENGTFTATNLFQSGDTEGAAEAANVLFGCPGIVKVITHMEITVFQHLDRLDDEMNKTY